MSRFLRIMLIGGIGALSATAVTRAEDIQVESKIIFNTACARCHEGECSGRMSFHLPKSAADQHILRHGGGDLPPERIGQLFELLRYMKEECGFYPMASAYGQDGVWDSEELTQLRSPARQAYFVFLGDLEAGSYGLLVQGQNDNPKYCIEVVNSEFDYYEKQQVTAKVGKVVLRFSTDKSSGYYLRVTAEEPLVLHRLELEAIKNNGVAQ